MWARLKTLDEINLAVRSGLHVEYTSFVGENIQVERNHGSWITIHVPLERKPDGYFRVELEAVRYSEPEDMPKHYGNF